MNTSYSFLWTHMTCISGERVSESHERWTHRIQRAGHLCYWQEHYTDGKPLANMYRLAYCIHYLKAIVHF